MPEFTHDKVINVLQEQQAHWMTFASKVMGNSMKLFELNVRIAKESLEDTAHTMQHVMTTKSPDEVFTLDAKKIQAKLDRLMAYANEVSAITSELSTEVCHMAQSQLNKASDKVHKFREEAHLATPQNHQPPFDFMYSALGNVSKGYEQWMDAGKKFAEVVEHNLTIPMEHTSHKKKNGRSTLN